MLVEINPRNIDSRLITQAVEVLKKGGLIIFPTDTVYSMGCDLRNKKALENLAKFKGIKLSKANFSIICHDLSNLSEYVKHIDRPTFKLLKHSFPGPFTFILPASKEVPKILQSRKKNIGLRIPDNLIAVAIIKTLGHPILSTSFPGDEVEEYTDPEIIFENWGNQIDMVVDGGIGGITPSTVVDCTTDAYQVIRQGAGVWDF